VNFTGIFAGDAQGISNIETGTRGFQHYEAWVQQDFGGRGSVRAQISWTF
jgi:carbohydrate-selective porin OprB